MDIKIAATRIKELVDLRLAEYDNTSNSFVSDTTDVGYWHIVTVLENIESGEIADEKAHRWLGWAQCAIVAAGIGTLTEMKEINHKA